MAWQLVVRARRLTWSAHGLRQRKILALIVGVSLFSCAHFLARSEGVFSAGLQRQETSENRVVHGSDVQRLNELGNGALWPPPPSSDQVTQEGEFPFKPARPPGDISELSGVNSLGRLRQAKMAVKRHEEPFPWPVRQNFIPNYFLNYDNASLSPAAEDKPMRFDSHSVLVYLHHNKAAGTTTKRCLSDIAGASLGRTVGPVLSSEGRLAVEARFMRKRRFKMRSTPNVYFGGYSFGLCDRYKKPCAYFTVMRDPYERTLSSHSYCKHARQDQLCSAQVARRVSLHEWALHQGSFFFRQLLFQPVFCSDKTRWMRYIDIEGVPHDFVMKQDWLRSAPCWFRQKLIMELTLNETLHEALLQYCLENMERWFTVIMLVDHYDESLQMAQQALKLPMYDRCAGRRYNAGSYNKTSNPINVSKSMEPNGTIAGHQPTTDPSAEKQLLELRKDPEIRKILRADELLYRKGVEIFNKQRVVFKKIQSQT
ncbi:uncharacterized protein LOC110978211 [Acanthaster planci]|uniref:Uncharacterized protein LOC110978211 n=1 Tax=Acanthaster planci TaxID=133434 RepID=A0A8B7Y675_ACAPL|nr:uncharacterized protein LOC110978211 [Acanthaster planci]